MKKLIKAEIFEKGHKYDENILVMSDKVKTTIKVANISIVVDKKSLLNAIKY